MRERFSSLFPGPEEWAEARRQAKPCAEQFRLPFRTRAWRGVSGNWMGAGVGASIDFQDHRPYLPGDDPRYLDWRAFARTGHPIMKLFREETSPRVDLVFDVSASMFLGTVKSARSLELAAFCAESALRAGASLRAAAIRYDRWAPVDAEALRGGAWPDLAAETPAAPRPPGLDALPLRTGALRVLISDLLYPGDPELVLIPLTRARGVGLILCPYATNEADPDWDGNVEFVDCESGRHRLQRVRAPALDRYRATYARHFDLWSERSRRFSVTLARIRAEAPLASVLLQQALPAGAVETCR